MGHWGANLTYYDHPRLHMSPTLVRLSTKSAASILSDLRLYIAISKNILVADGAFQGDVYKDKISTNRKIVRYIYEFTAPYHSIMGAVLSSPPSRSFRRYVSSHYRVAILYSEHLYDRWNLFAYRRPSPRSQNRDT